MRKYAVRGHNSICLLNKLAIRSLFKRSTNLMRTGYEMEYKLFANALLQTNLTMFTTISTFMCIIILSGYRNTHFSHCDRALWFIWWALMIILMKTWFMYEFESWIYDYGFDIVFCMITFDGLSSFVTNDRNKSVTTITALPFESPAVTKILHYTI